jgi:Phosphotransferase enzyme family
VSRADTLGQLPRFETSALARQFGKAVEIVITEGVPILDHLIHIAEQFNTDGRILSVQEYGTGNVNDTFLVSLGDPEAPSHFILQRINQHVFRKPELIMVNMRALTEHVHRRLAAERNGHRLERRWEIPRVFSTKAGINYHIDAEKGFWRAISFIDHSTAYPRIQDARHACEAGYALGRFQSLISDLPIDQLHDTLVGFHVTPGYLQHYDEVVAMMADGAVSPDVRKCMAFVAERRHFAHVLEDAKESGTLLTRPMHGDPKIDNIMIDDMSRQAISIIDLDTVKPGLVHYDLGDCLRSCCNPIGEETEEVDRVRFEVDLCSDILSGYLQSAGSFFTSSDYNFVYESIRLITFELGLRFFTDHLAGNVYFKARHREHNLQRALVQFKLVESIESQERQIRQLIIDLK